jgi:hypothetical protein
MLVAGQPDSYFGFDDDDVATIVEGTATASLFTLDSYSRLTTTDGQYVGVDDPDSDSDLVLELSDSPPSYLTLWTFNGTGFATVDGISSFCQDDDDVVRVLISPDDDCSTPIGLVLNSESPYTASRVSV